MWEVEYDKETKGWIVTRRVGNEFYLLCSNEVAHTLCAALNVVIDITKENRND